MHSPHKIILSLVLVSSLLLPNIAGAQKKLKEDSSEQMQVTSTQPMDLRGRPTGKPLKVKDNKFTIELNAFKPASFLLDKM